MRLFGNSKNTSGQKKAGRSNERQLGFQGLEERQMMAANITVVNLSYSAGAPYYVSVTGTDSHDDIVIENVQMKGYVDVKVTIKDGTTGNVLKQKTFSGGNGNLPDHFIVSGLNGNDTIINNTGIKSVMDGGNGADVLIGGSADDTLMGRAGNDSIDGRGGNDTLYGDAGYDWLWGREGADWLYGGTENDHLVGDQGMDHLFGEAGNDWLYGGANDDVLDGGDGDDYLAGQAGNDTLKGGLGLDTLDGGADNDVLDGGYDGKQDVMTGGTGRDTFVRRVSSFGWPGTTVLEGENVLDFNAVDDVFSNVVVEPVLTLNTQPVLAIAF